MISLFAFSAYLVAFVFLCWKVLLHNENDTPDAELCVCSAGLNEELLPVTWGSVNQCHLRMLRRSGLEADENRKNVVAWRCLQIWSGNEQ